VLSFTGNIVQKEGKPRLHAHLLVGKADGTAHGHFLEGRVWPTLEMIVSEVPVHLRRTPRRGERPRADQSSCVMGAGPKRFGEER